MKILSLDPGITTGYAILEPNGDLVESGNLCQEDLDDSILVALSSDTNISVVIEDIPIPTRSPMNRQLAEIVSWLDYHFPKARKVSPGVWKTNLPVANLPIPRKWENSGMTTHQKDAYRMGVWFMLQKETHE